MKRIRVLQLSLVFILLLVFGCVFGQAQTQNIYTDKDNGKTITVNMGDVFVVKLPENPSTGYSWNLTASGGLKVVSDRYIPNPTSNQVVGSGGNHVWTIQAINPGIYTVSGTYKRPWEPAAASDQHFTLNVKVAGSQGSSLPSAQAQNVYADNDKGKTITVNLGNTHGGVTGSLGSPLPSWIISLQNMKFFVKHIGI